MAGTIDEYKRLFREATVADQMKLFKIHIAIYLVVNLIWLVLNAMVPIKIMPGWAVYYSPIGWGLLVIVHYWFFVRGADNLCRLERKRLRPRLAEPNSSFFNLGKTWSEASDLTDSEVQ